MITVEISHRDIDLAIKARKLREAGKANGVADYLSQSCPLANAVRRKFHNHTSVSSKVTVTKNVKGRYITRQFGFTESAANFVSQFDRRREVFPTAVHLTEKAS